MIPNKETDDADRDTHPSVSSHSPAENVRNGCSTRDQTDNKPAYPQHRANEGVVDYCVNSSAFAELPRVFCGGAVVFPVYRDLCERVFTLALLLNSK